MAVTAATLRLEADLRRQLAQLVAGQTRDLVRAWATAWDEIAPDLRDTLATLYAEAERGTVTRRTLNRSRRLTAELQVVAEQLENLAAASGVRINRDVRDVVRQAARAQGRILASQLPDDQDLVDIDLLPSDRALEAIVRRTTQQITALHYPLSEDAYAGVVGELIRGTAVGTSPRATAQRMTRRAEDQFNGGLTRALTISRTETLDAHRAGAGAGQDQHADVLAGWVWLAALSPRTCRACLGMHGREFPLEVPGPQGHQQCRCARQPKTLSWAELGIDLDEPADSTPDADEYFAHLSKADQIAILGRRGYDAWVAGDFPREAWAELRENPGWRPAWVQAKPPNRAADGSGGSGGRTPPPAPPAPGPDDDLPPMGPVLGTPEQQAYVKDGERLPLPRDENGRIQLPPQDNANVWHTYVPDDEDRTTALLQYMYDSEVLVKAIARSMHAGEERSRSLDDSIDMLHASLRIRGDTGVRAAGYTRDDLIADLEGAAARLLARPVVDIGTVYRGLVLRGVDLLDEDLLEQAMAALQLTSWWYASASPDRDIAIRYAMGSGVSVLIKILGARGVVLQSMGNMSPAPEVLLSGGLAVTAYDLVGNTIIVVGRWQP